jgi:hypothetical protein
METTTARVENLITEFSKFSEIRQFQILWCGLIAFSLIIDYPAHMRFFRWFHHSGLKMASVTGHGQSAGKFYGIIPSPKLSVHSTAAVGACLILSLVLACTNLVDPRPCLAVALVCHHCYISQIYAEVHVVAHNMALVPPAMILCMVCPDIVQYASEGTTAVGHQWPLFLLKFIATSAYSSAAICKITKCFTDKADWTSGASMQAVMFEAIMSLNLPGGEAAHMTFSKPTPFSRALQRWLFKQPRLLGLMSVYGVIVEFIAPLVLFFPILNIPFALLGLGLHYGIAYCQNIDFIAWWGPFYVVFFLGNSEHLAQIGTMAIDYQQAYPVGFALGLAYLALHVFGMVIHRMPGFRDMDILPLSRFPMFDSPKNLWDPAKPHWAWLTDKKQAPGELMNFAFPMCRPQHVLGSEFDLLPFRHLLFGRAKPDDTKMTIYSNVVITDELQIILDRFFAEWQKGADKAYDPETLQGMLDLVDEAKAAFEKAPRRSLLDAEGASSAARAASWFDRFGLSWLANATRYADSKLQPLLESNASAMA